MFPVAVFPNDSGRFQVEPCTTEASPIDLKVNGVRKEFFQSLQPISLCSRADVFQSKGRNVIPLLQSSGCRASQAATMLLMRKEAKEVSQKHSLDLSISTLNRASELNLNQNPDLETEVLLELCRNLIWRNKGDDVDQVLTIFHDHPQVIEKIEVRALWKIGCTLYLRKSVADLDRSISILEKAASKLKNNQDELILHSEILCDLGNTLLVRNDPQDLSRAIRYLETAKANLSTASDKTNVDAQLLKVLCALGNAYGTRGGNEDVKLAIALLTRASKLPCDNISVMLTVLRNLCLCLSTKNDPRDTELRITYIKRSIELSRHESDGEKYKHLSALIYELLKRMGPGDRDLLIKTFEAATQLALPPEAKVRIFLDLGDQLRSRNRRGDLDKSIILYRRAAEINVKKCAQLAEALLKRGTKNDIAEANTLIQRHLVSLPEGQKDAFNISR